MCKNVSNKLYCRTADFPQQKCVLPPMLINFANIFRLVNCNIIKTFDWCISILPTTIKTQGKSTEQEMFSNQSKCLEGEKATLNRRN